MRFRHLPPVCLLVALFRIITGQLRYTSKNMNKKVQTNEGSEYYIFRQISTFQAIHSEQNCVFIVRFKFRHLSHNANKIASLIPMLLIAGHPGFISKCYAVNHKNGYWQGIYQWESLKHLKDYKNSFVYRMMNQRAVPQSIYTTVFPNNTVDNYIQNNQKEKVKSHDTKNSRSTNVSPAFEL